MGESKVLLCPYRYLEDVMVKLELKIQLCPVFIQSIFKWVYRRASDDREREIWWMPFSVLAIHWFFSPFFLCFSRITHKFIWMDGKRSVVDRELLLSQTKTVARWRSMCPLLVYKCTVFTISMYTVDASQRDLGESPEVQVAVSVQWVFVGWLWITINW